MNAPNLKAAVGAIEGKFKVLKKTEFRGETSLHVERTEIENLARSLLPKVGEVAIVAEERHEIAENSEASLNQVRIEVAPERLPDDEHELDMLCGRLVEAAERWAQDCIAERHAEVSEL